MHIFIEICKKLYACEGFFAQKPAETPLREQELLMRGLDHADEMQTYHSTPLSTV